MSWSESHFGGGFFLRPGAAKTATIQWANGPLPRGSAPGGQKKHQPPPPKAHGGLGRGLQRRPHPYIDLIIDQTLRNPRWFITNAYPLHAPKKNIPLVCDLPAPPPHGVVEGRPPPPRTHRGPGGRGTAGAGPHPCAVHPPLRQMRSIPIPTPWTRGHTF